MVNSLRKVDFSHPTGHYTWDKFSPGADTGFRGGRPVLDWCLNVIE